MSDTDSTDSVAPLVAYFAAFSLFTYQPISPAHNNFNRLCQIYGWAGNSAGRSSTRQEFNDALVQQFNFIYGTDENDLNAWHNLCRVIEIEPLPDTVDACRRRVWDAHVNIVDLVDTYNTGRRVRTFASLEELKQYTKTTKKFFPKDRAYQGGLLKDLLREILHLYFGRRRNGSQRRRMRRARRRAEAEAEAEAAAAGGTA